MELANVAFWSHIMNKYEYAYPLEMLDILMLDILFNLTVLVSTLMLPIFSDYISFIWSWNC